MKKLLVAVFALALLLLPQVPLSAQTNSGSSSTVAALMAQIKALQEQLALLRSQTPPTTPPTLPPVEVRPVGSFCYEFKSNLGIGARSGEVGYLQSALQLEGFSIDSGEVELGEYGESTAAAVVSFQQKYGIVPASGFTGALTRSKLNSLYSCSRTSEPVVNLSASKNGYAIEKTLNMYTEEMVRFRAELRNVSGVAGQDYQTAWFFDPVFDGACSKSGAEGSSMWLECTPKTGGESKFYLELYLNGKTYRSNIIYVTVKAVGQPAQYVRVLSPNGGETWLQGTTQKIAWQDLIPIPLCPIGAACAPRPTPLYDISIIPFDSHVYPPCTTDVCPVMQSAYIIARNVQGWSYAWQAGAADVKGGLPNGAYTMQVCRSGTADCDSSDSYFKLTSNSTTNHAPEVILGSAPAGNLIPGKIYDFSWQAKDADNDDLSWSISWGEGVGGGSAAVICGRSGKGQTFSASHGWTKPGTYTVKATVRDCAGASDESEVQVIVSEVVAKAPVISGLDAPTALRVGQSGTWTIKASDPSTRGLSYSVVWGDEPNVANAPGVSLPPVVQQTATFTHVYSTPGKFTPTFSVSNPFGAARTSASVIVSGLKPVPDPVPVPTPVPVKIDLSNKVQYGADKSSAFVTTSISPRSDNAKVDSWTLSIECSKGATLVVDGKNDKDSEPLCGTTRKMKSSDYANIAQGAIIYTARATNTEKRAAKITYSLLAYDANGQKLGSDMENVELTPGTAKEEQTLKVIFPNGRDELTAGSRYRIRWSSTGLPATALLKITLVKDYGETGIVVGDSVPNTGSYVKAIPKGFYGTYKLVISTQDGTVSDTSDAFFTVKNPVAATTTTGASILQSIWRSFGFGD